MMQREHYLVHASVLQCSCCFIAVRKLDLIADGVQSHVGESCGSGSEANQCFDDILRSLYVSCHVLVDTAMDSEAVV